MSLLDHIVANGNREYLNYSADSIIHCDDGFSLSVVAGFGVYCTPPFEQHQHVTGPFTHVEVGFPSQRPEPWDEWSKYVEDDRDPTMTVYGYVPVEMVRALIELHGGEV